MKTEAFPTYLKFSELLSSDRTQEAVAFFERGFRKGDSLAWPGIIVVFPRGRLSHYSVKLSSTVSQYIHDSVILVAH